MWACPSQFAKTGALHAEGHGGVSRVPGEGGCKGQKAWGVSSPSRLIDARACGIRREHEG